MRTHARARTKESTTTSELLHPAPLYALKIYTLHLISGKIYSLYPIFFCTSELLHPTPLCSASCRLLLSSKNKVVKTNIHATPYSAVLLSSVVSRVSTAPVRIYVKHYKYVTHYKYIYIYIYTYSI